MKREDRSGFIFHLQKKQKPQEQIPIMNNTSSGDQSVKISLILILCMLVWCTLPAGAAETLTVGLSSGGGAPDAPEENVSVYIHDVKAAVAEQNWTSALLLSTRGLAYYPEDADLLCLQAYTYRKMGQFTKSVDVVSKAIPLDPKPVRYANRGYGYLALHNYSAALNDAESGISLNTTYATNYGVKALALQGMGRNADAIAAIEQALFLEPENAHYWHVDGVILAAGGNCTGARYALERSLAIDPGYVLAYPGFTGARENLAALDTTCIAAAQVPASPTPAKSSAGAIAVFGVIGAIIALGMRK